jgi:hypothetical protein
MRHIKSRQFEKMFDALPADVQEAARHSYALLKANPRHPSLHFKPLKAGGIYWSARVGIHHRALARAVDGNFLWNWIGTHAEYDRVIRVL